METMTHVELKEIFEIEQKKLSDIRKAFPWDNKEAYANWLVNTYEYVINTSKILATAGGRMPEEKNDVSNRFIAHASEEKGHENLLKYDVKNLGLRMENLQSSTFGQAFHQSLYYWLYANNPLGIFGWVLALEGFAVRNCTAMNDVCSKAFGPKASSFLKVHADVDDDHLGKAFECIETFSGEENALIAHSLKFYSRMYGELLQRIHADAVRNPQKMAA